MWIQCCLDHFIFILYFHRGNPCEIMKSISRKTWLREHLQNKHKHCVSKQQSIDKYKEKGKSQNLQITWHLNVKYKSVLFTDTLNIIQYLPKLQITMTWHRGRRFSALTQATSKSIKRHLTQAWSHFTFRWISSKYRRSWLPALPPIGIATSTLRCETTQHSSCTCLDSLIQ